MIYVIAAASFAAGIAARHYGEMFWSEYVVPFLKRITG